MRPTLFDYINRAMPFPSPHLLTADQVYALTAYVLNLNDIVGDDFVADQDSLPKVKMPNRDGFIWKDPRPDTARHRLHERRAATPDDIKITSTAEGKHVDAAHHRSARHGDAAMTHFGRSRSRN